MPGIHVILMCLSIACLLIAAVGLVMDRAAWASAGWLGMLFYVLATLTGK